MVVDGIRKEDTGIGRCLNLRMANQSRSEQHPKEIFRACGIFLMGQNASRRYATDDPALTRLLETVMGNQKAANLFWSCLLAHECQPMSFLDGLITENRGSCQQHGIGARLDESVTSALDAFCIEAGISRFAVIISALAVLVERYSDNHTFWITHNYGVTGTPNRKLKYPITKVDLHYGDAAVSFRDLCEAQDELIQKSSYHLCIPTLPSGEHEPDRKLGVFLLDPKSGHTRESISAGLTQCAFPVVIELDENNGIVLHMYYDSCSISATLASRIFKQITFTLENCLTFRDLDDVRCIPTVPKDQEDQLLNQSVFKQAPEFMNVSFPELNFTLGELIRMQMTRNPTAVALQQFLPAQSFLTYEELLREAEIVKQTILSEFQVQGNSRIGVLLHRGMNQVIAVLGILLAGCAYVPMDPQNHPPERIEFILRDSGAVGILTDSSVSVARSFQSRFPSINVNELHGGIGETLEHIPVPALSPDDIAYVIYTSGSTGNPKGVLVPHRGIVNDIFCVFKQYMQSDFSLIRNVLLSTNLCFDAHVDELFLPLVFGGTITCMESNIAQSKLEPAWGLTFVQSTPSVFQVIDIPDSVKCVLIGGEALTKATIERVLAPGRIVINGYGPTETTNESSLHLVTSVDDFKSIGKPIWNTQFYVFDKSGKNCVPQLAWGELYIGGIGVTRGYSNLPDLTRSVFIDDHPLLPEGTRIYKTGDIVRINENGDIEFKGRASACGQIKLRGYRIELGEIQYAILSNNKHIREAHVCVSDFSGSPSIVAYIAPAVTIESIVYGQLPEYMKPSMIVPLPVFPRNISGKLDLKALPRPTVNSVTPDGNFESSCIKAQVSEAFRQTLGIESPLAESCNFFMMGGNSLNVISLKAKLTELVGVPAESIKLQLLFQLQTVGEISKYLESLVGPDQEKSPIIETDALLVQLGSLAAHALPIFCVHAAGGQVHTYSSLANSLTDNSDISFFAIQDPSLLLGPSHRLSSFEAMGALYAKRINAFYPEGPVFLAGHSSGGSIAVETARSLENDFCRKIGCVFLIDTECDDGEQSAYSNGHAGTIERLDEIKQYLYSGWKEGLVEDYLNAMTTVSESNGGQTWQLIKALLPSRRTDSLRWSNDLLDMIGLLSHHLQIEKKYSPFRAKGKVRFPLILFRPADEDNRESNWEKATEEKFVQVDVPDVNHYTLVREPAVELLAAVIKDVIEQTTRTDITARE